VLHSLDEQVCAKACARVHARVGAAAPAPAVAVLLLFAGLSPALAEDPPKPERWTDSAELSYVATAGNAETSTLGFKNTLGRKWEKSAIEIKAGAVRAEATTTTRVAVGPSTTSFDVVEDEHTEPTAENYYLNGRYDWKLTDRFFWFSGGGWERNRFAGVDNRYSAVGGIGNIWADTDRRKFRTDYAVTMTKQEDVVEVPGVDDTFAGLRFSSKYLQKIGAVTTYGNDFIVDGNLEESSDVRGDMTNWLAVAMSAHLALKVSLQFLYDNEPSFESVDLENPLGTPTGQSVLVQLDELDTIFTTSLVINF
jgi:putative salt-induced outer membrane protein YdiY